MSNGRFAGSTFVGVADGGDGVTTTGVCVRLAVPVGMGGMVVLAGGAVAHATTKAGSKSHQEG